METTLSWRELASSTLHDYTHFGDEFRTDLDDWSDVLLSERVRSTLGSDSLKLIRRDLDSIRKRLDADFTLLVAGDFKRGKSTLINALLGQKVASSNVTPETVTINRFRYAPNISVSATLENGAKVGLEFEDIQLERLEPILEKMANPISFLSVDVPAPWLQGVTIVDTPGMGDVLGRFDKAVQDYLHQADSVVYVVSALSPLSETEERFLRQSLASHDFPKLIFVVNMIDFAKTEDEEARLMGRIAPRLMSLFPQAQVFAVSALDELCRQLGVERPNAERQERLAGNFEALRTHLERAIFLNRQRIQLDRSCDLTQRMLDRVRENCQRLGSALEHDSVKLRDAIEQCEDGTSALHQKMEQDKEELAQFISQAGQEASRWMGQFLDRLRHDIPAQLSESKVESVQRYFPFFLAEVTREALGQCVSTHQSAIIAKVQEAQAHFASDFAELGGATKQASNKMTGKALWSNFSGQSAFMTVMSLTGLAEILNIFTTKKRQTDQLASYVKGITESLEEFSTSIRSQVGIIYGDLAEEVLKEFQEGFQTELESASAALRQAQELQAQGASHQQSTGQVLAEVGACCEEASAKLDDLEQRLWFSEVN